MISARSVVIVAGINELLRDNIAQKDDVKSHCLSIY